MFGGVHERPLVRFATEPDAYLVYYHLLKSWILMQRVTEETCRAMSVEPEGATPDRLYYISPQTQLISRDELCNPSRPHNHFIARGVSWSIRV